MSVMQAVALLLLMGAASYFQTVTGFGLGMIVIGAASGLDLAPMASVAAVVSLVTLVNSAIALPGKLHHVDWRAVRAATLGLIPAVGAGVVLLGYLSGRAAGILQFLLGAVILYGGLGAALRPEPLKQRSDDRHFFASGVSGGLLSGMFGISGPPLVFQFYRQPMTLVEIRCALIVIFAVTAVIRTLFSAWQGQLDRAIWIQSALAVPMVMLATIAARRYPPPISGVATRRIAFGVLVGIGCYLMINAALPWIK